MPFNSSNLSRVTLHKNPNYQKNGLKSYVYLLQKFNINPTIEGPFCMVTQVEQTGTQAIMKKSREEIGGKAHLEGKTLAKKDASNQTGRLSAEDIQFDSMYLAEVDIGTPAQTLKLDFDTGSADLWCWSTDLSTDVQTHGKQTGHAIFNKGASSSWTPSDPKEIWKIQYGDGSTASGKVGTDTVTVGGLKIYNQAVETADNMSSQFQSGTGDGLLGLAFGNINTVRSQDGTPAPVHTPVENMISQDDIPKNAELFTAYLGSWRDKNDPDQGQSFYTFGYIDQDVVDASGQSIYYTNVDSSNGFWQFSSTNAAVNGITINRGDKNTAIADTGTTLALVDDETCEAIYGAIHGAQKSREAQGWIFPSSTTADQLPNVQFAVGSKLFTVEKEDLAFVEVGNGMVYGGIQSRGDMPFDILGDTFLKSIYAIFDQGNSRFGCVQRVDQIQNLATPPS